MCRCGLHRKQARRDVFFPPPGSLREAHCAGARWVPWVPDRKNCKINPDSASGVILPLHSRVQGTASLSSPLGALTSCQGEGWSDIFPSSSTTANKIALPSRVALLFLFVGWVSRERNRSRTLQRACPVSAANGNSLARSRPMIRITGALYPQTVFARQCLPCNDVSVYPYLPNSRPTSLTRPC